MNKKFKWTLFLGFAVILTFVAAFLMKAATRATFAQGDEEDLIQRMGEQNFVTFYDEGAKLTVKTEAKTVGEALERADIIINQGDIVEPSVETEINSNNYFVNIHRARPVMIRDGMVEKYLMSASFDAKTIAEEADITLYDGDEIKIVPNTNFLEAGMVSIYEITRNGGRVLTVDEEIPFKEEKVKDYNLDPEVSEVRQLGEVGTKRLSYNVLYKDGKEVSRELISEEIVRNPVNRVVAVGASEIERHPLTVSMGRNYYTVKKKDGSTVLRQETYYDLNMRIVLHYCGGKNYSVREDGAKVDQDGYILVAANLQRYPRCSVVETSLGAGKVYDTGGFAAGNPEQFDLATDWSNHDGV
ncbi:G5 domain-containing protein [Candidatus Saccharibacteria bacterium]|nr:G5 domain-containing protein [Candidatus Saccharibacteria bacterium]